MAHEAQIKKKGWIKVMTQYVVRQPIKDFNKHVIGYEILFDNECGSLYNHGDDRTAADAISNFLMQGSNQFVDNKKAFLTFTPNLLFRNVPHIFQSDKLVIQIDDNVIIHPLAQSMINRFKEEGYEIAFNDFQFAPRYFAMMDIMDYIRLNFESDHRDSYENLVKTVRSLGKKCIAYNVNTKEAFDLATALNMDFVQGTYIGDKISGEVVHMEYLQSNFFQLVVEVTKDEPDLAIVEEVISRDVSLTYSLLKLVNSAYFALRNRATSIMQALVILGLGQLKQWVYLMSFRQDGEAVDEDLLKTSMLRAQFCSALLPCAQDMTISKSEAYLLGMFSTLDRVVGVPMENALQELSISDEIKNALLRGEGRCGLLYQMMLAYEQADWKTMIGFAEQLGIQQNNISKIYFECVESVNEVWSNLMTMSATGEA